MKMIMTTMIDAIADLPGALELAAFERMPDGAFQPVGRLPEWFLAAKGTGEEKLSKRFPVLGMFLKQVKLEWRGTSDIWTEPDADGSDRYLQAIATEVDGHRFLVLKTLPRELHKYQQLAHDFELEKQKVERLSREVEIKRQEAERATQAKSEFLARMSHEIRTPLNAVIGMADVLAAGALTPEQRRCVEVSQRNGIGLLNLINDILDLSKVEAGKVELETTPMDLRDVIARAMEVVEGRATAKGLTLSSSIAPGVPLGLIGDPNRLRQILINLLGNSIKFTDRGGLEVRICQDPDDNTPGRLRFGVKDTGIGIAPDKIHAVFESFTQADTSTTRKYGGTGLGLTISKQLVELMNGKIWVESQPGLGSTFFFTATLGVAAEQPDASHPAAGHEAKHTRTVAALESQASEMRILLADDSEDNRFLILSYLKRTNASVEIAENGAEAVELFKKGCFDLVLMDVEMPVMDGYAATRAIRELERCGAIEPTPVLALTAHAFADLAEKGSAAGFTELLTKPIRNVTLLEAIGKYPRRNHAASGETQPIRIQVEDDMRDVVPGYLAKRRAEVPLYRDAMGKGDMDAVRTMAHRMKGTGTGYGMPVLTEMGSALEQAAKRLDASEVRLKVEELAQYLDNIELEYK